MNNNLKASNSKNLNTAHIPQKNRSNLIHTNIEKYKQFDSSVLNIEELNDYLEFCSEIYPNEETELGLLFNEEINKEKALSFLHKNNYDIIKTKFLLAFPIMHKYTGVKKLNLCYSEDEMIDLLREFQKDKGGDSLSKEKLFFKELLKNFEYGEKQLAYEEVNLIFENALKKRFTVPSWINEEFQKCKEFGFRINKVLENSEKNISEIDNVIRESSYYKIIPENLNRIKFLKNNINELLKKIENFLSSQEKDILNMNDLMKELKFLKLDINQNVYLQTFHKFYHQTQNIFTRIHQIQKPNENTAKISMETLCKIMYFFTENNIKQNEKFLELIIFVKKMECIKEKCLMWVEDNRDKNPNNIFHLLKDLKNCSIDYSKDIKLIYLKLETLNLLKTLETNSNNEQELYKNLKLITEYETQNKKLFREEIQKFKNILIAIQKVDDKIEKINSMNCTIENFLFDTPTLMPLDELEKALQSDVLINRKNEYLIKVFNFIDQFKAYLNSVLNYKTLSNLELYEKIRQILEFALSCEPLMSNIKEEMLKRIKMEYYLIMFFEKFAFKKFPYPFQQFEVYFKNNFKEFNSITEGLEYFEENESYLKGLSVYTYYKWFSNNYKTIKRLLTEGPRPEESILNLADIEKILKENFNDQELMNLFNSKKEINQKNYLSTPYEQNRNTMFLEHKDKEEEILEIKEDYKKSLDFFNKNIDELKKVYEDSKNIEIAIRSDKMKEIETLIKNKVEQNSDPSIDKFFKRISDIMNIKNKYENLYKVSKDFKNAEVESFVLKVPIFIIIFYKLRILGIQTEFIEEIENILDNYFKLDNILKIENRLTMKDLKRIKNNMKDFNIYNPKKYKVLHLLNLLENFINSTSSLENECRKGHICSKEVLERYIDKINIEKYDIELKNDHEIRLKKRGLDYFKDPDFKNFLTLNKIEPKEEKLENKEKKKSHRIKIIPYKKPDKKKTICMCQNYFKFADSKYFRFKGKNCHVKFHKNCIDIKDGRFEKEDEKCPACEFLDSDLNSKSEFFIEKKIPEVKFMIIFKAYCYLKEFIDHNQVDFVAYLVNKVEWIIKEINKINEGYYEEKIERIKKNLHKICLIYLYIPIRFLEIEKSIFKIQETLK